MWWDTNIQRNKHTHTHTHTPNIIITIHSADPKLSQVTTECTVSHRNTKYTEVVCNKNVMRMSYVLLSAIYTADN